MRRFLHLHIRGCSFWQEFIAIYVKFPILSKRPGNAACVLQTKCETAWPAALSSFDTNSASASTLSARWPRERKSASLSRQKAFVVLAHSVWLLFDLCDSTFYCICETTAVLCAGNKIKMKQNIYAFPNARTHMAARIRNTLPVKTTEPSVYLPEAQQHQQQYNSKKQ